MRVDIKSIIDDIQLEVLSNGGSIQFISFDASESTISIDVDVRNHANFSTLRTDFLELPWVTSCSPIDSKLQSDNFTHRATFTLGVDYLVK